MAVHLLGKIERVDGDRIFVHLNFPIFDHWMKSGAKFSLHRANGKIENGNFNFDQGDLGGSLHKGFDIQGYTSYWRAPRIQINYRFNDNLADIDLDVAAWFYGFIPNPDHLTYEGSDTRQWLPDYVKSLGDPGFQVQERFTNGE